MILFKLQQRKTFCRAFVPSSFKMQWCPFLLGEGGKNNCFMGRGVLRGSEAREFFSRPHRGYVLENAKRALIGIRFLALLLYFEISLKRNCFEVIMGSYLGTAMKETMDENMKKNQEFMLASQKLQVNKTSCLDRMYFESEIFTVPYFNLWRRISHLRVMQITFNLFLPFTKILL